MKNMVKSFMNLAAKRYIEKRRAELNSKISVDLPGDEIFKILKKIEICDIFLNEIK